MALGKLLRNEVVRAVQGAGFSAEEFDWGDFLAEEVTVRHRRAGASFVFGGSAGDYVSRYYVADDPVEERTGMSWFGLKQQLEFWLSALKLDIETPDLWAELQGEEELFMAVSDEAMENTPFTPAEQEEIAGQLRELKGYVIRTHSLSEAQTRLLEERLDYLAAAAGRVGRKDWMLLAAGVMLGYVLTAALPPEAARDIVGTLLTSIGHIVGGRPPGLPGG